MKGYIYKIFSMSTNKIYIGSTNKDINIRYKQHKKAYDNYIDGNSDYCTSYQIIKYNDSKIEIVREVETTTSLELKKLESEEVYKNCDICVNFVYNNKLKQLKELKKEEYKQKLLLIKNKEIQQKLEKRQLKEQTEINKLNLKLENLENIDNFDIIMKFIENSTKKTNNKREFIKMCQLYDTFKQSQIYSNLTNVEKKKYNYKHFNQLIKTHVFLKLYCTLDKSNVMIISHHQLNNI